MTMRLNLNNILRHQLNENLNETDNHELAVPTEQEKATLRLGAGRSSAFRCLAETGDIKSRVHSMMANIHKHMKTTAPPRKAVPAIPAALAEIPAPPPVVVGKKSRRIRGGGGGVVGTSKTTVMPIAQMKARLNRQSQQVMRRGYADMGQKSYTNQRRIREVMMQKTVLENMLLQHKRLQRDRQTIALDIQRMRQDLDRIKTKLDTSLQTLNSTRTLFTGATKSKKSLLPITVPTFVTAATGSSNKPTKKSSVKSANITAKRQHLSSKRRSRQ